MFSLSKPISSNGSVQRIGITVPVLFLVLAATALPIEIRPLGETGIHFGFEDHFDVVVNILGYVPVGIVLGNLGLLRALLIAGAISLFAETSQLMMMHRDPSFADLVANVTGTMLGTLASARWRIRSPTIGIGRKEAVGATLLVCALTYHVWSLSGGPENSRGASLPGTLEAYWKLDESSGKMVLDSSGHDLTGEFRKEPKRIADAIGQVPVFDGANFVDFRHPAGLQLIGSMTISAWIKSSSYPIDDAVVVSGLHGDRGYQLDTTIDRGARTIGFKLTNASGDLMARYGATSLALETWYHILGVYDATARTLDVHLNGKLDNGFLLGPVSGTQLSSRGSVSVGRRADSKEFNFSGSIRDVRIYSFPLTESQIAGNMHGEAAFSPVNQTPKVEQPEHSISFSESDDKANPAFAAVLGTLVAVACLGFWPSAEWKLLLGLSFAVGLTLVSVTTVNLPAFNTWMTPLVSLAGGASVVVSVCRNKQAAVAGSP